MKQSTLWCASMAALAVSSSVQAQIGNQAAVQSVSVPQGYASAAFQAPTGSGGRLGYVGMGAYAQTIDSGSEDADGAAGLNIGLGDPAEFVGFDVSVDLPSLFGDVAGPDGFGENGSLGFKLHRNFPGYLSVAIGTQSTARWGDQDNRASTYLAGTKFFMLGSSGLAATLGVGDRAFADGRGEVGGIASLAYYIRPNVSLIGEYTGRFANVAVSVAPIRSWPLALTAGAVNLGDRFALGTQFAASVGYAFDLGR